jgi:hypothetical protein
MNWFLIIFFVLAVGLFLYTQYIRLKRESRKEKVEAFQAAVNLVNQTITEKLKSRHGITLNFIPPSKAIVEMQSNAKEYISQMNQPNLAARGFQTQSELLAAYSMLFQDITSAECETISQSILNLLDKLENKYPSYYRYLTKWIGKIGIAKASNNLEGGMPHTIGNIIIMDANWFVKPRETTFLHELTHVHQRQVPFEFDELYTQWGYLSTSVRNIRGIEPILTLNRNNPDGISPDWLWHSTTQPDQYWWIGAVFPTATPNGLGDVNLIGVKMERDSEGNFYYLKQQPSPLNSLTSFIQYFGANPNNYHPNEMAAKFAEVYLEDMLGTPNQSMQNRSEGYRVYMDHFNKIINTFY